MFRFTIRDVLWLTVVAALAVGWSLDHRQQLVKNYRAEMLRWRFRAESLRAHIETRIPAKVSFEQGYWGEEAVRIEDATGAYHAEPSTPITVPEQPRGE